VAKKGTLVTKLAARLLATASLGSESRHFSKIHIMSDVSKGVANTL
jgi:hypothetical protein